MAFQLVVNDLEKCECPLTGCKFIGQDFLIMDGDIQAEVGHKKAGIDASLLPFKHAYHFSLLLMLDVSGAIGRNRNGEVSQLVNATTKFVKRVLTEAAGLEIAVYAFARHVHKIADFTTKSSVLTQAIEKLPETIEKFDITTNLKGAIVNGLKILKTHGDSVDPCRGNYLEGFAKPFHGKLLVFSDGGDECNCEPDHDDKDPETFAREFREKHKLEGAHRHGMGGERVCSEWISHV